jgi:hypothetical protein
VRQDTARFDDAQRALSAPGTGNPTGNEREPKRLPVAKIAGAVVISLLVLGGTLIIAASIPQCRHLTVQLHYAPGDNQPRDADNLWPTLKAAADALAHNGRGIGLDLVPDDTPAHMTKVAPVIHPGPGPRRLWLTVEVTR